MRDDYNEIIPTLYGIGIGPGDYRLLTLKARDILKHCPTIFVPKSRDDEVSFARSIVQKVTSVPKNFRELVFPMTKDKKRLRAYWQKAAKSISQELKKNKQACFVTIGDPFIYSTYIYLLETLQKYYPQVKLETVPGISSFSAAASACGMPLVKGNEKLAILPVTNSLKGIKQALKDFDTVVLMKVGSKLVRVIRLLKDMGRIKTSVLISHVGHCNEEIIRDLSSLKEKKIGYLSVLIVKK